VELFTIKLKFCPRYDDFYQQVESQFPLANYLIVVGEGGLAETGGGRITQEKLDGEVSKSYSLSRALTLNVWLPAPRST
jgi:hypothetical protein